jgi:hypothetical protein
VVVVAATADHGLTLARAENVHALGDQERKAFAAGCFVATRRNVQISRRGFGARKQREAGGDRAQRTLGRPRTIGARRSVDVHVFGIGAEGGTREDSVGSAIRGVHIGRTRAAAGDRAIRGVATASAAATSAAATSAAATSAAASRAASGEVAPGAQAPAARVAASARSAATQAARIERGVAGFEHDVLYTGELAARRRESVNDRRK